jgi:hypothetical protein
MSGGCIGAETVRNAIQGQGSVALAAALLDGSPIAESASLPAALANAGVSAK